MGDYRNIQEVIESEKESIEYYQERIEAWEAVTIKKKKNGEDWDDFTIRTYTEPFFVPGHWVEGSENTVF